MSNSALSKCQSHDSDSNNDNTREPAMSRISLDALDNSHHHHEEEEEETDSIYFSCPLCFEILQSRDRILVLTNCRHEFCGDCMGKWTALNESSGGASCPFCRLPLPPDDVRSILDQHYQQPQTGCGDNQDFNLALQVYPRIRPGELDWNGPRMTGNEWEGDPFASLMSWA